jgi:hypothetical protein
MLNDQSNMEDYRKTYHMDKLIGIDGEIAATGQADVWLDKNCIEMWIKEYIKLSTSESYKKDFELKLGRILNIFKRLNHENNCHSHD